MTARPRVRLTRGAMAAVILFAACTPAAPSAGPSAAVPASGSAPAATPGRTSIATPVATLPGGLEPRSGRPALVNGEAAACIPLCGQGRVAGGRLPAGRYQTEWFFGGYMTLETDGTWKRGEDSNGELGLPHLRKCDGCVSAGRAVRHATFPRINLFDGLGQIAVE